MCGRYVSTRSPEDLTGLFGAAAPGPDAVVPPSWNVAPTDPVWAVLERADRETGLLERRLRPLRWGLVPSWSKDPGGAARMINARVETVAEKPAYRRAYATRRCLLPADGFYEWQAVPATATAKAYKQPYFISPQDGTVMAMAGLYEFWRDPAVTDGDDPAAWWATCTVITTEATDAAGRVHPGCRWPSPPPTTTPGWTPGTGTRTPCAPSSPPPPKAAWRSARSAPRSTASATTAPGSWTIRWSPGPADPGRLLGAGGGVRLRQPAQRREHPVPQDRGHGHRFDEVLTGGLAGQGREIRARHLRRRLGVGVEHSGEAGVPGPRQGRQGRGEASPAGQSGDARQPRASMSRATRSRARTVSASASPPCSGTSRSVTAPRSLWTGRSVSSTAASTSRMAARESPPTSRRPRTSRSLRSWASP